MKTEGKFQQNLIDQLRLFPPPSVKPLIDLENTQVKKEKLEHNRDSLKQINSIIQNQQIARKSIQRISRDLDDLEDQHKRELSQQFLNYQNESEIQKIKELFNGAGPFENQQMRQQLKEEIYKRKSKSIDLTKSLEIQDLDCLKCLGKLDEKQKNAKKEIVFQIDPTYLNQNQGPVNNGRWTKQEHEQFISALKSNGKNWQKVFEAVSTRNEQQVRSHAQKFFNKLKKKKNIQGTELYDAMVSYNSRQLGFHKKDAEKTLKSLGLNKTKTIQKDKYFLDKRDKTANNEVSQSTSSPGLFHTQRKLSQQYPILKNLNSSTTLNSLVFNVQTPSEREVYLEKKKEIDQESQSSLDTYAKANQIFLVEKVSKPLIMNQLTQLNEIRQGFQNTEQQDINQAMIDNRVSVSNFLPISDQEFEQFLNWKYMQLSSQLQQQQQKQSLSTDKSSMHSNMQQPIRGASIDSIFQLEQQLRQSNNRMASQPDQINHLVDNMNRFSIEEDQPAHPNINQDEINKLKARISNRMSQRIGDHNLDQEQFQDQDKNYDQFQQLDQEMIEQRDSMLSNISQFLAQRNISNYSKNGGSNRQAVNADSFSNTHGLNNSFVGINNNLPMSIENLQSSLLFKNTFLGGIGLQYQDKNSNYDVHMSGTSSQGSMAINNNYLNGLSCGIRESNRQTLNLQNSFLQNDLYIQLEIQRFRNDSQRGGSMMTPASQGAALGNLGNFYSPGDNNNFINQMVSQQQHLSNINANNNGNSNLFNQIVQQSNSFNQNLINSTLNQTQNNINLKSGAFKVPENDHKNQQNSSYRQNRMGIRMTDDFKDF
eukprot:403363545